MSKSSKIKKLDLQKMFQEFDKTNPDDMIKLTTLIQEKAAKNPEYKDYTVYNVSADGHYAWIAPSEYIYEEDSDGAIIIGIDVQLGTEPAAQKKTVGQTEAEHPGFYVTDFTRPEPSKCYVRLEQLDDKVLTARRIFSAVLGLQPWNLRVSRTPEGGWKLRIKEGTITYQASRYDVKMQEAVETVGKEGWFFRANPKTGVIMVYPGKPPTFKPTIGMPKEIWSKPNVRYSYFGMKLPDKGRETGDPLAIDWKNSAFALVCGEAGGGKSVIIDSLIYGRIVAGCQLYIGDEEGKSIDYAWCRPYVAQYGWGGDGLESTAAMLIEVLRQVDKRAALWKKYGWTNWWELPKSAQEENPQILLVMDEVSQLDVPARLPAGLDKDNPDMIRKKYENSVKFSIQENMLRIVQKARYVGVTGIYSAQSATQEAGIPPIMRTNLQSKIISGEKVPEATRKSVLKDPKHAPFVPLNVVKEGVGKGTGIAELSGQEACVFKGYFEETPNMTWSDILRERAMSIRPVPLNMQAGRISGDMIMKLFPTAAGKPDDGAMYEDDGEPDPAETEGFGEDGRDVADRDAPLKGAAAAAHASRLSAIEMAKLTGRQAAEKGL